MRRRHAKFVSLPSVLTALLLDAGASRELGMPLRADMNAEILAWLSPPSLRKLNDTWQAHGFGHPAEVNEIVREWLEEGSHRRLEIVVPGIQQMPPFLLPLAEQVELTPASATTYLERFL